MKSLLVHGVDINRNILYLEGDVGVHMYKRVTRLMPLLGIDPFVVLNTEGGDFYQGLAIYDFLKNYANLTIVCTGPVMSAGTIILQAATHRLATPCAQIMVHYGEDSNSNAEQAKHNAEMLKLMKELLSARLKVTKRTLNNWFTKDTYFTAQRAMEVGLIDKVVDHV